MLLSSDSLWTGCVYTQVNEREFCSGEVFKKEIMLRLKIVNYQEVT